MADIKAAIFFALSMTGWIFERTYTTDAQVAHMDGQFLPIENEVERTLNEALYGWSAMVDTKKATVDGGDPLITVCKMLITCSTTDFTDNWFYYFNDVVGLFALAQYTNDCTVEGPYLWLSFVTTTNRHVERSIVNGYKT